MGAEQSPMTEAMYYILLSLLKPGHGYGMMARIRELSGGRINMGPGTLYGVLTRMKKEGLIELESEEERRKNYSITDAGREALWKEYERLKALVKDGKIIEEAEQEESSKDTAGADMTDEDMTGEDAAGAETQIGGGV